MFPADWDAKVQVIKRQARSYFLSILMETDRKDVHVYVAQCGMRGDMNDKVIVTPQMSDANLPN